MSTAAPTARNHYDVLQISKTATQEEIKKQFRILSLQNHPDKGGDPQVYQEMVSAYQVIGDPEKRQIYDMYGDIGIPLQYLRGIKYVLMGLILTLILIIIQFLLWDQGNWFLIFIPTFIIYAILLIVILDGLLHPHSDDMEEIQPKDVRMLSGLLLFIFLVFFTMHLLLLIKLQLFPSWRLELILIPYWIIEFVLLVRSLFAFKVHLAPDNPKMEFGLKVIGLLNDICRISFIILLCIRQQYEFDWAFIFLPLFLIPVIKSILPIYWCKLDKANIGSQIPVFVTNGMVLLQFILFYLSTNGNIQTREAFIPILIILFLLLIMTTITGIGFVLSLKKEEVPMQPITDPARMIKN